MLKAYALRIHRWLAVVFALPLLVLITTGLILSFEPAVSTLSIQRDALSVEQLDAMIAKADPQNKAKMLTVRPFDGIVSIGGRSNAAQFDMQTGEPVQGSGGLTALMNAARGLHEHLIFDLDWLVTLSTIAMLVLIAIGLIMGLPKMLRNTASGWHKATAWGLLPLLILSPLTGLFLALNITFSGPSVAGEQGVTLREAVQTIGKSHDLTALIWIRGRGDSLMARVNDNGFYRVYGVGKTGLTELPGNWPRLIHEGNWSGLWSALVNIITSVALMILLITGFIIWYRRQFRKKPVRG